MGSDHGGQYKIRKHVFSFNQPKKIFYEHSMMVQGKNFLSPGTVLFLGSSANLLTFYILSALADLFNNLTVSNWIELQDEFIGIGLLFIAFITLTVSYFTSRSLIVFSWLLFFASMIPSVVKYF
ncbi:MAG: hypothetical protein A4E53_03878 [Pelotomaculum sp. PtaB.Bin104]|nr:MAG: hypothetical protein A4E53_03878 [Pelotomaculum sp. PtaB.Bin104]